MRGLMISALAAAAVLAAPAPGAPKAASEFDGSKDLLCATLRAADCGRAGACESGLPDEFNIPAFVTVSFSDNAIRALRPDQSVLDTAIQSKTGEDGRLILQGVENGRGWSAAISEQTGRFVVSVAGEDVAFAVFGTCTVLP